MKHHIQDIPPSIVRAIAEIQKDMKSVTRDGKNAHGGYMFASTDAVYAALSAKMGQVGLTILTLETDPEFVTVEGAKGPQRWGKFRFTFVLATEEGTWTDDSCSRTLFLQILGPQTHMAAQSYAEKTFLRSLFKLPTGDLDLDHLPGEGKPETAAKSSSAAKKEGLWEAFTQEVEMALNLEDAHQAMSMLNTIEARYTPQMPRGKWLEQMHDELNRARDSAGNMQLI